MDDELNNHPGKGDHLNAYAGRWIARVDGRIVAQGGTPQQAQKLAQTLRYKEKSSVTYVEMTQLLHFPKIIQTIFPLLPPEEEIYMVGGVLRDALLGHEAHDLDFCMKGNPIPLARKIANAIGGAFYVLDDERGTARIISYTETWARYSIDFASFRGPDLESDLQARDFTINAMAVNVKEPQKLLDPLGGAADLRNKAVRICSPTSLSDDPLRILRGIRLAVDLSLRITPETRQAMKASIEDIAQVSAERKRDELFRILEGTHPATAVQAMDKLGCLPQLLPELTVLKGVTQSAPHIYDVWDHTLAVVKQLDLLFNVLVYRADPDLNANLIMGEASLNLGHLGENLRKHFDDRLNPNRSSKALLLLTALYHDIAKPATREVEPGGVVHNIGHEKLGAEVIALRAQALQLSNSESDRMRTIIRHHMRIHSLVETKKPPTRRAIYRFFRDTGEAGIDICLFSLADALATYGPTLDQDTWAAYVKICRTLLEAYWNAEETVINPPVIINGDDLQKELKVAPGPRMGILLEAVREAQVEGMVTTKAEAIEFSRGWLSKPHQDKKSKAR